MMVVNPPKIIGVGRNYGAHAKELGNETPTEPILFLKPRTALLAPHQPIVLPKGVGRVEHEGEIGIVSEIATHPSVDALVIKTPDGRTLEQPLVPDWILRVSVAEKLVELSTLEGMIR